MQCITIQHNTVQCNTAQRQYILVSCKNIDNSELNVYLWQLHNSEGGVYIAMFPINIVPNRSISCLFSTGGIRLTGTLFNSLNIKENDTVPTFKSCTKCLGMFYGRTPDISPGHGCMDYLRTERSFD